MSKHEAKPEQVTPAEKPELTTSSPKDERDNAGDKMREEVHVVRRPRTISAAELSVAHTDKIAARAPGETKSEPKSKATDAAGSSAVHGRPVALAGNARRSVQQLVDTGVFTRADSETAELATERQEKQTISDKVDEKAKRLEAVSKIKVVYEDQTNDPSQRISRADFRIKKDGSIEVLHDPDRNNKKELVVEIERDQGQIAGPTEAQQQSADQLVGYLTDRLMKDRNADGTKDGIIEDRQGLVSDSVKQELKPQPAPEDDFEEPARRQIRNMERFSSGGRGVMTPEQADSYFPPREVPRQADETNQKVSIKDVVASMSTAGDTKPYEAVHKHGNSWGVGRYQLSYELIADWLTDLLGDPPDPAKLAQLERTNPKLAAHLKSAAFKNLLEKLKNGEKPSAKDIAEALPKEMQEQVAGHLIDKFSQATKDGKGNVDPAKVALAMHLGHVPTAEELSQPQNKSFLKAAEKLESIAAARTENPGRSLEWQDIRTGQDGDMPQSKLSVKLATNAERIATRIDTVGMCYAGAKQALNTIGVSLHGGSAYMAADQLARDSRFVEVPLSQVSKGDVLVHGRNSAHKHGHIAISLGNGKEASDHVQHLIKGKGYGGTRVFRLKPTLNA